MIPFSSYVFNNDIPARRYQPLGRCLYCDSTEGLTKEHVIPYGLVANTLVLPKASCASCQKLIQPIENACLTNLLGRFRVKTRLPSRRKRRNPKAAQPTSFPLTITSQDGTVRIKDVPISDYPTTLILPKFPEPSILNNLPAKPKYEYGCYVFTEVDKFHIHKASSTDRITIGDLNPDMFLRWLAKMAHGYAIAENVAPFRPLLLDLIKGNYSTPTHLVGCFREMQPAIAPLPTGPTSAQVSSFWITFFNANAYSRRYILCEIRMFRYYPTPTYWVVVGEDLRQPESVPPHITFG